MHHGFYADWMDAFLSVSLKDVYVQEERLRGNTKQEIATLGS